MTTNDDATVPGQLPPAGWLRDPAGQTRWWDGVRWTEHVQPIASPTGYGAEFGIDTRMRDQPSSSQNGPAKASLILIVIQLVGGIALLGIVAAMAAGGTPIWGMLGLLGALSMIGFMMTVAAFVLAIVGTVIAVRRPTRKREAVFALVYTSLAIALIAARTMASLATYGTL